MRFHWGAAPTDPDFRPEAEGWYKLRGPSPSALILYSLPVAFVVMVIMNFLWLLAGVEVIFPIHRAWWASIPLLILPVIFIHELLHAIGYLDRGLSDKTVIGFWPSKMIAYAFHLAPISRTRLLIVGMLPFFALSLLPLLAFAVLGATFFSKEVTTGLYFLSIANGMLSSGDILGEVLLLAQIPASAVIRMDGWETYWKPGTTGK